MRLHLRHGDSVPTIHKYRRPKIFVYEKFPKTEDRRYSLMKNFRRPKTEYLRSWKISEYRRPNSTIRSQLFANTEESKYSVQLWSSTPTSDWATDGKFVLKMRSEQKIPQSCLFLLQFICNRKKWGNLYNFYYFIGPWKQSVNYKCLSVSIHKKIFCKYNTWSN